VNIKDFGRDAEDFGAVFDFGFASPFVVETNLTLCPAAAHFAATPPALNSQSSGCAPNAIIRNVIVVSLSQFAKACTE
jgi:hypothetical protein